jgi:hypothetical protein
MTARRVVRTFLMLIAALASSVDGQPASPQTARATRKLTPIDAARHDASLRTLRNVLLKAADANDAAQLLPLFASQVVIDFHDPLKPGEVVNEINGYSPSDQALFWQDLREAVELGFIRWGMEVCAPYVIFQLEELALSDAEPIGIVAARVNVRRDGLCPSSFSTTGSVDSTCCRVKSAAAAWRCVRRPPNLRARGPDSTLTVSHRPSSGVVPSHVFSHSR